MKALFSEARKKRVESRGEERVQKLNINFS